MWSREWISCKISLTGESFDAVSSYIVVPTRLLPSLRLRVPDLISKTLVQVPARNIMPEPCSGAAILGENGQESIQLPESGDSDVAVHLARYLHS